MIKYIPSTELRVGMYIHDLNADWSQHPFMRSAFPVKSDQEIETILKCGIRDVYIDTDRGLDVPDAPTKSEVQKDLQAEMIAIAESEPALKIRISSAEEMGRAKAIKHQAANLVRNVMAD